MSNFIKITDDNQELMHFGVLGMKWGHTKKGYRSTSIRSAVARRSNDNVDRGFKDWQVNAQKKQTAIDAGKRRNETQMLYSQNKGSKEHRSAYKQAEKEYKKTLGSNTTYRKGDIKQEVGQDLSRKLLSEAKRLKKQIDQGNGDPKTKKQYQKLMNQYDVERAKARRAPMVAQRRSAKKASMKRAMTMTVKAAVIGAAVTAGGKFVNYKLETAGREPINVSKVVNFAKKAKDFVGYF